MAGLGRGEGGEGGGSGEAVTQAGWQGFTGPARASMLDLEDR